VCSGSSDIEAHLFDCLSNQSRVQRVELFVKVAAFCVSSMLTLLVRVCAKIIEVRFGNMLMSDLVLLKHRIWGFGLHPIDDTCFTGD